MSGEVDLGGQGADLDREHRLGGSVGKVLAGNSISRQLDDLEALSPPLGAMRSLALSPRSHPLPGATV